MLTTEQKNSLICEHISLANILASSKKKKLSQIHFEELQAAAYLGLVEAASHYDPGKGVEFGAFARLRIIGAMQDFLRTLGFGSKGGNSNRQKAFLSIDRCDHDRETIAETIPCRQNSFQETFDDLVHDLPQRGKDIIRMRYCDGLKVYEIAELFGVGATRISQMLTQYTSQLRVA